ncbi:hypothetical protein [Tranquillimonas alkanivorans]|uniref:Uncharacterized protein n=1 Tax=Tranquillimonas alkanivorans TaxID=441119 RepID=A0A1I5RAK3_9RHOB|nr:hypothetical protein [Tranquillimonas alkanivorans]SFP55549.1 hypothetical protein SAMN04488047_10879 [Tranquillimonas alkanivorans]
MAYRRSIMRRPLDRDARRAEVEKIDAAIFSDRDGARDEAERDETLRTPVRIHVFIVDEVEDTGIRRKLLAAARKGIRDENGQGFLAQSPELAASFAFELMKGKSKADLESETPAQAAQRAATLFRRHRAAVFKDMIADALEARGLTAAADTVEGVFDRLDAAGTQPGGTDFADHVIDALDATGNYVTSAVTRPVKAADIRPLVGSVKALGKGRQDEIAAALAARGVVNPLAIQREAIAATLPSTAYHRLLTVAKNAISANGGASVLAVYGFDELAGAALYEALKGEAKPAEVEEETVRAAVEEFFRQNQAVLYKDRIAAVFAERYVDADAGRVDAAYELLRERRVPLNDPDFAEKLIESLPELRVYENYEPLFSTLRDSGPSAPMQDFRQPLPPGLKRSAISLLNSLNVNPDTLDNDWARAALSSVGSGGAYGSGGSGGTFSGVLGGLASPPHLPPVRMRRFEDEFTAGIEGDRIRTMARAYYIYQFDRLGIIDMVEELIARQRSFSYDLGNSPANALMSHYRQVYRIVYPAAEDRRRTFAAVFEEGPRGEASRNLLGALGEAGIDLQRVNNAGAYFSGDVGRGYSYARFRFVRAGMNLQRFLSDVGGYHMPDLVDRCWHQLHFCFSILERPEVQQYWGGRFNSGLWAVVEGLLNEAIGDSREDRRRVYGTQLTDRARTLAVFGHDLFDWLADNASTLQTAPDAEIDRGLAVLQNWLAAFRRPDTVGDWIDDDSFYDGGEDAPTDIGDEYAAEAERDALQDADML